MTITIDKAQQELTEILSRLKPGESATLVDADGQPVAMLVSLKETTETKMARSEYWARWEALAEEISKAWKDDKSAVEAISEMRR